MLRCVRSKDGRPGRGIPLCVVCVCMCALYVCVYCVCVLCVCVVCECCVCVCIVEIRHETSVARQFQITRPLMYMYGHVVQCVHGMV